MNFFARLFAPKPRRGIGVSPQFTPRVRQLLALARREAARRGHDPVEPAHALVALARLPTGTGLDLLRELQVDLAALRRRLEEQLPAGAGETDARSLPYSVDFKRSLALAGKEARALNHRYVGTEHFLLGLVRSRHRLVTAVLAEHAINPERIRQAIRGGERPPSEEPRPSAPE